MREESAEQPRAPTRPVTLDPRHQAPVVVVENRQRHRAEERERVHVPVDPCLGHRRRVCPNVRCVAVRQVEGEEMDFLLDPTNERPRFAKIGLRVPRRMNQRHVHLPTPAMMLANMVLHDRVPAGEAVLVAKTLEDALRGVPLLAMVLLAIPPQPLVDESGNSSASQLRRASDGAPALCVGTPAGRRTRASSSRSRVRPRNGAPPRARSSRPGTPDAPCDTAPRCESSHPPHDRKGLTLWQSFAPPRRDHPAATVVWFCAAVCKHQRQRQIRRVGRNGRHRCQLSARRVHVRRRGELRPSLPTCPRHWRPVELV